MIRKLLRDWKAVYYAAQFEWDVVASEEGEDPEETWSIFDHVDSKGEDHHLIAAAPDLLAACQAILDENIGFIEAQNIAREAIAKATAKD